MATTIPKFTSTFAIGKRPSVLSTAIVSESKAASSLSGGFRHMEGLSYALLKNKYYVGEKINGVKIIAKDGNVLRLANDVVLYENRFYNGNVVHVMKLGLNKGSDDIWRLSSGEKADGIYTFVIDMDNKLVVAPGNVHHTWLVDGAPVRYAGEIHYKDGKFIKWTNKSGHYLPDELAYLPKVADNAISVEKIIKDFLQN